MLSSIDAADKAVSPPIQREVMGREVLWSGGIISIAVPPVTSPASNLLKESLYYTGFVQFVKGGVIPFYVYGDGSTRLCGTRIIAEVQVMRRKMSDGHTSLYVDLKPLPEGTLCTHRLAVQCSDSDILMQDGFVAFKTPRPLTGVILLAPFGSKFTSKTPIPTPVPALPLAPQPKSVRSVAAVVKKPVDTELRKLLDAGWKITGEQGRKVTLSRMKDGSPRTMTHRRPKN